MDTITYNAQAEIYQEPSSDYNNPYLTYAKFVLLDDQPNGNKKGVEYEDFPRLSKTAIGMPVKLRYLMNSAGGHKASVPFGHIISVEEKTLSDSLHQLIATAVLWEDEFPNEVKYLKDAYASGKAPGISWELGYNSEVQKNGIGWYKGVVTKAATFVNQPAYGTRTALIALASLDDDKALEKELVALASRLKGNPEGGKTVEEAEALELQRKNKEFKAKIADLESQLAAAVAQATKVDGDLKTAQAELQAKDEAIQEFEKQALIATRTQKMAEIGFKLEPEADKAKVRQEFWASLPEPAFNSYVTDLQTAMASAKQPKTAVASLNISSPPVPKLNASQEEGKMTLGALGSRLKNASRGITVNE